MEDAHPKAICKKGYKALKGIAVTRDAEVYLLPLDLTCLITSHKPNWSCWILIDTHIQSNLHITKLNQPWHAICCPKPIKAQTKVLYCHNRLWHGVYWQTINNKVSAPLHQITKVSEIHTIRARERRACLMNRLSFKCVEFLFKQSKRLLSTYWIVLL